MALEYAHGAIDVLSTDVATTTKTVSGLAFQPKAIRFAWAGIQSATDATSQSVNEHRGVGFAATTSSRRAVATFAQDTAATSNCGGVARNDAVMCTTDGAAGSDGEVDIDLINSDGFRLIVDDQLAQSITIFWEAWGGGSITSVTIGDIAEPAGTGNQDYSATGFVAGATDQVVMFAGVQSTAAVNTAASTDSGLMIGYATGTGNENILIIGNSDDASMAMDTDRYAIAGECLGMIVVAGGTAVDARASLTQFGTDNFRLNWAARALTDRRYIYMAIKGGEWRAGETTINVQSLNNTATVANLPFTPIGLSIISHGGAENSSNSASTQDVIMFGCASSALSRRGMIVRDVNATASSACEILLAIEYDEVIVDLDNAGAIAALIDIDAMSSEGFRFIVDDADATGQTAFWIGYLAFGNKIQGARRELTRDQPMIRGPM